MRKTAGNKIEELKEVSRSCKALKNPPREKLWKKMVSYICGNKETLR